MYLNSILGPTTLQMPDGTIRHFRELVITLNGYRVRDCKDGKCFAVGTDDPDAPPPGPVPGMILCYGWDHEKGEFQMDPDADASGGGRPTTWQVKGMIGIDFDPERVEV
jgi:hypothetical protein